MGRESRHQLNPLGGSGPGDDVLRERSLREAKNIVLKRFVSELLALHQVVEAADKDSGGVVVPLVRLPIHRGTL